MAALGTRLLSLTIDGVVRDAECSRAAVLAADTESDFVSFADAAAGGGRDYKLALTFVQDPGDENSIWSLVFDQAGTDVEVVVRPYGNETPSASQPHFTGTVTIVEPDGDFLGGEADASTTAKFVTEAEFPFTAKPTKVTA